MSDQTTNPEILERGNIYFAYRPVVGEESPQGLVDVQRFYMILSPEGKKLHRRIVIGQKKLPQLEEDERKPFWAFVERVSDKPEEIVEDIEDDTRTTGTRGARYQPGPRPAAEGVYALVRHADHTELAYVLELPEKIGEVQEALRIAKQASYALTVKNPEASSPPGIGLEEEERAEFPEELQSRFGDRRFVELDTPDFLDYEGTEILLIAAENEVAGDLEIELNAEKETEESADIFSQLRMSRDEHPTASLFEGKWT